MRCQSRTLTDPSKSISLKFFCPNLSMATKLNIDCPYCRRSQLWLERALLSNHPSTITPQHVCRLVQDDLDSTEHQRVFLLTKCSTRKQEVDPPDATAPQQSLGFRVILGLWFRKTLLPFLTRLLLLQPYHQSTSAYLLTTGDVLRYHSCVFVIRTFYRTHRFYICAVGLCFCSPGSPRYNYTLSPWLW